MARKNSKVQDYRHDEKRKNNPPIGMVSYEPKIAEGKTRHYAYDPLTQHASQLIFKNDFEGGFS